MKGQADIDRQATKKKCPKQHEQRIPMKHCTIAYQLITPIDLPTKQAKQSLGFILPENSHHIEWYS